ncbi:MAG: hypothetical protein WCA06_17910 [Terrimicrobiaceae bacterium]
MNTSVVDKAVGNLRQKSRPSFSTVLVYEDLTCGERAWSFYEKLTRRFEGDFQFSHLMWSFSVLGSPQTLVLAARSAADAHLVILCFTGNTTLPANVKDWVRRWARLANNQNSALVTLVDQKARSGTAIATHSYLRRILDARKIDFFPHGFSASALRISRPE